MISHNAIIHPNVILGENCIVEDYAIIGISPLGTEETELKTTIGNNAIIRSHTVIYAGNIIGNYFQTGNKANIRELNKIGDNVSIGALSVVEHHTVIGNGVRIHSQVFIPEYTVLGNECWIGPNVVLTNAKYPNSPAAKKELTACKIQEKAIIGANSTILPGITIGQNALIGAATVVTKNVTSRCVVFGSPAHVYKKIDDLPY